MHYVICCYSERAESICLMWNLGTAESGPISVTINPSIKPFTVLYSTFDSKQEHAFSTSFTVTICHFLCKWSPINHSFDVHLHKQIHCNIAHSPPCVLCTTPTTLLVYIWFYLYFACMHVYHMHACCLQKLKDHQIPLN